ncbi:MAG: hypothetical protein ACK5KU_04945 [Beutenbergiaceae bacterium]
MSPVAVHYDSRQPDAQTLADILASLPVSLTDGMTGAGGVAAVSGHQGWPDRVRQALEGGARAVWLNDPIPADVPDLGTALVQVHSPWADNDIVTQAAITMGQAMTASSRLEVEVVGPMGSDNAHELLRVLALIRGLIGPVVTAQVISRCADEAEIEASAGVEITYPVDLSIIHSDAVPARVRVRLLEMQGSVTLNIPAPTTARPACLTVVSPTGQTAWPTSYESSTRTSWRRLLNQVVSHESSLPALDHDLQLTRNTLP